MKKIINPGILLILCTIIFSGCSSNKLAAQTKASASITYQSFYDNLSPYGTWIDYPGYGHVWNPRIEGEFRPYVTNGNWIYSTEGWAWTSNYPWGWAPFHYGRWLYDDMYGWLWVPGYEWAPAWVTWGFVDDYYCWAPLMPEVNVELAFGSWRPHSFYWNICSRSHIYDREIARVIVPPGHFNNIVTRISIINNFNTTHVHSYYSRGPEVSEVEKYTNRKIERVSFRNVDRLNEEQHQGKLVKVYRPEIRNPRPSEFRRADAEHVKPIRSNDEWPSMQRGDQRNNIEHLPEHREPSASFGNAHAGRQGSEHRGR